MSFFLFFFFDLYAFLSQVFVDLNVLIQLFLGYSRRVLDLLVHCAKTDGNA